jgi:hypothetical protein
VSVCRSRQRELVTGERNGPNSLVEAHKTRFEELMEPDHDEKTSHDFTIVAADSGVGVCICRIDDNRQELLAE